MFFKDESKTGNNGLQAYGKEDDISLISLILQEHG